MAGQSEVTQRINLNGKQYRDETRRIASETKAAFGQTRKELQLAQTSFHDYTNEVKKDGGSILATLKSMGKSFAENLGRGAVGGAVVTGVDAMRAGMKNAVSTSISFSDALAKLGSRADLSQAKLAKLREEFFKIGKATGADLGSIAGGANVLYGATGNMDQAMSAMNPIAKAAAVNGGNAEEIASFVADRLKGENKEVNEANVKDLLGGLVLAQRGGEFNSIQESMQAFKGLPEGVQSRTGLSNRDLAALFSGATRAGGNRDTGVAAVQAITRMSQEGFAGDATLGGVLGIGSFKKNGKFDMGQLTKAAGNVGRLGNSEQQRMAMLTQVSGLSDQEAQGLLSILEHIQKFNDGVQKVEKDTKSFDQSMEESADSLGTDMKRLNNEIVGGFSDIFSPLMKMAHQIASGHLPTNILGNIGDSVAGAVKHPVLVAGGLAATAAGGFLMKQLGIGGLAKGVATGKALEAAGVQPVYVTNASEIAKDANSVADDFLKKTEALATEGSGPAAVAAEFGVGGIAAMISGALGAIGLTAYAYTHPDSDVTKQGAINPSGGAGIPGTGLLERPPESKYDREHRIKIEIDSKDPAFKARPKATDNPRDSRSP